MAHVLAHPLPTTEIECLAALSKGNELGPSGGMGKKLNAWEHDEGHANSTCALDMIHPNCNTMCVTNS